MERSRFRTVIFFLVFLVVTPATAAPPPQSVCEPCGSGFSEAATWYGERTNLENEMATGVEHSTATVRVYENGTAIWTVRNRLTSERAAQFFRENTYAFTKIARDAEGHSDTTFLSARVANDDTVVLRYRSDEQVTRTRGDVLRFDGFREVGARRISELGADEMTVVGPSRTHITRAPSEATVRGNELELSSYEDDGGDGAFVTFTQSGGLVGEVWSFVSISELLADDVVRNLLFDILLPAVALLTLLVGLVRISGKTVRRDERTAKLLAGIVTALGILTLGVGFVELLRWGNFGDTILVAGGAYTALALLTFADVRLTLPRVAAGVLLAWVVGLTVLLVSAVAVNSYIATGLVALDYYTINNLFLTASSILFLLSMAVVGYAATDPRYRRLGIALPPTILAATLATMRPITHVRTPLDFVYSLLFAVLILVAVTLFGIPAFLLGQTIPAKKS